MKNRDNYYYHLFKDNLIPIVIFDEQGIINEVNYAAIKMFQLDENELSNYNFFHMLNIKRDFYKNKLKRRFTTHIYKNNFKRYLDITIGDIKIEAKQYYYATIDDITEFKELEQALKNTFKENELIINSINAILICLDQDKNIYKWNREAENVLEIPTENAIGENITKLNIQWDIEKIEENLNKAKDKPIHMDEINFIDKNSNVKKLAFTIYPIIDMKETRGYLLLGKDITQKKIMESQLIHFQKLEAIGELAAGIAHEINTPVQYVYGNLSYIKDTIVNVLELVSEYKKIVSDCLKTSTSKNDFIEKVKEKEQEVDVDFLVEDLPNALDESIQGLERVIKIVRSMRRFSHSGEAEEKFFDINASIEDTIEISRNVWKYHSDIKLELDENLPPVFGNPDEINQVLLNIIVNAAHAITEKVTSMNLQEKGLITIRTLKKDNMVEIQIQDTGTGIPKTIRDKIFDPFFTTKEVGKGTGQGLYLSYNIIKKHNGNIFFETEEGKGTTFCIQLPIKEAESFEENEDLI